MASNTNSTKKESINDGVRVYGTSSTSDDGIRVYAASSRSTRYSSSNSSLIDDRFSTRQSYNFDELYKLVGFINSNNLLRSKTISHKKNVRKLEVCNFNGNVDLYTLQTIDIQEPKYEVDHVLEIQCFVFVVAAALHNFEDDNHGRIIFEHLREKLSTVINSNINLNVTDRNTNLVKMNVFKVFIKMRWVHRDRGIADFLKTSNFDKCIDRYCNCLKKACEGIREQLVIFKNEADTNDSLKVRYAWQKFLDEFDLFFTSMKI